MKLKQGDAVLLDGCLGMVFHVGEKEIEIKTCDTDGHGTVNLIEPENIENENLKLIKTAEFLLSETR